MLLLPLLLSSAHAEDDSPPAEDNSAPAEDNSAPAEDNYFFVGGALAVRPSYDAAGFALAGEGEADLRFAHGILSGRLDLDVNATAVPTLGIVKAGPGVPVIDIVRPEYAQLQLGSDTWIARGGIVNPGFGLESWDDWENYLPTFETSWAAKTGRMAGAEVGRVFGDGAVEVDIGGGFDLDYVLPMFDASVSYEGDKFSTWSGVALYPFDDQYLLILAGEAYPSELVTISVDGLVATFAGSPLVHGALYGVFLPEAVVNPTVRVQGHFDPDGYLGAAPLVVSAGGAIWPTDWSKIMLEGKLSMGAGPVSPGVYASFCVFRPEPE